jgi:hypothetical protein
MASGLREALAWPRNAPGPVGRAFEERTVDRGLNGMPPKLSGLRKSVHVHEDGSKLFEETISGVQLMGTEFSAGQNRWASVTALDVTGS